MDTKIEVLNPSYDELFSMRDGGYKIKIPPYQRPYVWNENKVLQLLDDWKEFVENEVSCLSVNKWYYMGTAIVHIDNDKHLLNIVDGQQRLTTLMMIDLIINEKNSALRKYANCIDFTFSSHISQSNIAKNTRLIEKKLKEEYQYTNIRQIFSHLKFTVIITDSEDDAFTFFDSQNNRGIRPAAVDVMKAVHLRAIQNDENLRISCAKEWQEMQLVSKNIFRNTPEEYMDNLVDMALWRARRWRGEIFENESSYDTAMDEFANCPKKGMGNIVKLYTTQTKTVIQYFQNFKTEIISQDKDMMRTIKFLQFNIRQPLYKGVCAFAYFKTYHQIAFLLFEDDCEDKEVMEMRKLYQGLYLKTNSSKYMTDYFIMMMIAYYDKFGSKQLSRFAKMLDYVIGMTRLNTYYFRSVTMRNMMKKHNLLDGLQICFEPEEIMEYIASIEFEDNLQSNEPINNYISACKDYYGKQDYDGDIREVKLKWAAL